jgi:hypothetical protein
VIKGGNDEKRRNQAADNGSKEKVKFINFECIIIQAKVGKIS